MAHGERRQAAGSIILGLVMLSMVVTIIHFLPDTIETVAFVLWGGK
jgi:hypothetical protein